MVKLNIDPLIQQFQEKNTSCIRLPLSVVGRCNLIKLIWNPEILYALHNAPIWIPIHVFKRFNTIYHTLILRKPVPRIKIETLQEAKDSGTGSTKSIFLLYGGSAATFKGLALP